MNIHCSLTVITSLTLLQSMVGERIPYAAGLFYPKDQQELIKTISNLSNHVEKKEVTDAQSQPKILIVPHAGYAYSGLIAMEGITTIKDQAIDTFIIIGPYHKEAFSGVSIWTEGSWQTPLGKIAIESSLAKAIQKKNGAFNYTAEIHNSEHSLEVQIPFIQYFFPKATIVPILISDIQYSEVLADALYNEIITIKKSIAIIISTDMSHYHNQNEANQIDQKTIQILEKNNPSLFQDSVIKHESELCGTAAVQTGLFLAEKFNDRKFLLYDYHTSGESTGDTKSVVGYLTAGLVTGAKPQEITNNLYTKEQQQLLLSIARKTLMQYVKTGQKPVFEYQDPFLKKEKAVFITIRNNNGELRGCIGRTMAEEPLLDAIIHMTIEAATKDQRFKPVTIDELDSISIEISILSEPTTVASADEIIFKQDGVILSKDNNRGVFLPEVANDFSTKEDFLNELCTQKAELPLECWKDENTRIETFTTETMREN
jgi:AmmeMemoRadiSam system protein B/AmmeMemoRadiSam system protein A